MNWRLRPILAAAAFVACLAGAELVRGLLDQDGPTALRIVLAALLSGLAILCAYVAIKGLELRKEVRAETVKLRQNIEGFRRWFEAQTNRYKEVRNDVKDDQDAGDIVQGSVLANAQASELVIYLRSVRDRWFGDVAEPRDILLKHAGVKELSQIDRNLADVFRQISDELNETRQKLHSEATELVQSIGRADLVRVFQHTLRQMGIDELLTPW